MSRPRQDAFSLQQTLCRLAPALIVGSYLICNVSLSAAKQPAAAKAQQALAPADSPLLREPGTPSETYGAVLTLVDLGRADLAEGYLKSLVEGDLPDDVVLALRNEYGTASFLRLTNVNELRPMALGLLNRLSAAAKAQAEDPEFVSNILDRLLAGTPTERELAQLELTAAGPVAIPRVLDRIRAGSLGEERDSLVFAVSKMGPAVVAPLIATLDSSNPLLVNAAIEMLGWLTAEEALPFLYAPAFSAKSNDDLRMAATLAIDRIRLSLHRRSGGLGKPARTNSADAAAQLNDLANRYLRQQTVSKVDLDGFAPVWGWDEASSNVVMTRVAAHKASLYMATRLARDGLRLSPANPETQRLYLTAALAHEVEQNGWRDPVQFAPSKLADVVLKAGPQKASELLAFALSVGQPGAALVAIQVLGETASEAEVMGPAGRNSPILTALSYPDERIQFAAASAVLQMDPRRPFPASHRVVEILKRALTAQREATAVIITSDNEQSTELVAYVSDMGFEAVGAKTGKEGFELAATLGGVSLIVVHVNIAQWNLSQTLANLRADGRTAGIPVVLYGNGIDQNKLNRLIKASSPAVYVAEASSGGDFTRQLRPYLAMLRTPPLSAEERTLQRREAAYWFAHLTEGQRGRIFDVGDSAAELAAILGDPELVIPGMDALVSVPSADAQRRLVLICTDTSLPTKIRSIGARRLAYHIQRFGLLLDGESQALLSGAIATAEPELANAFSVLLGSLPDGESTLQSRLDQLPPVSVPVQ